MKKKKRKKIFILLLLSIGISLSIYKLKKSQIKITDKEYIDFITNNTFKTNKILETIINKTMEHTNPLKVLNNDYNKYKNSIEKEVIKETNKPIIYLYNTHQKEEYAPTTYAEFSVNPTVIINNYILEDIFNSNGYETFVESNSIKDILNQNNWKYYESYKASRILLEQSIIDNPTLKYFIDIHRDSLPKDRTTITINDKKYATILFIIGMENENYQENLEFTNKISNKITEKYPNLSKGIYKKSGPGVNGIYNQDFNPKTILIEIGGFENTTSEVLNTSLAFAECFMEVINEENN